MPVVRHRRDAEVHRPVADVGVAVLRQRRDEVGHRLQVLGVGCARVLFDRLDAETSSIGGVLSWYSLIHREPDDIKTPDGFLRLPYLTKDIIRRRKHDLVAPGQRLYGNSTSGSTGEPVWFFVSTDESIMRHALCPL